jgi:flagellar protein FliL
MATKAKAAPPPAEDEEEPREGESEATNAAPQKRGLVGRILAPLSFLTRFVGFLNPLKLLKLPLKLQLIVIPGVLLAVLGVGAGAYVLLSGGEDVEEAAAEESGLQTAAPTLPAADATFFDIPDIIVNIQTADSTPAYLKLSVALELDKVDVNTTVEPVLPRIIDQFQTYLRELRVEDIKGSAGVMRLKEELLRRVNLAVAPTPVHDVLLKEMIVQ